MKKVFMIVIFAMSLQADVSLYKGLFSQGSTSVGIRLGGASIGSENYTIFGISGNYFVLDNLSVGLGYEKWFSGTPSIQKLTAESTYYVPASEKVRPYVGVLYRRIFIGNNHGDVNAYGYRAGMAFVQDRLLISAGIVQERYESSRRVLDDSETYGEVTIGISF